MKSRGMHSRPEGGSLVGGEDVSQEYKKYSGGGREGMVSHTFNSSALEAKATGSS